MLTSQNHLNLTALQYIHIYQHARESFNGYIIPSAQATQVLLLSPNFSAIASDGPLYNLTSKPSFAIVWPAKPLSHHIKPLLAFYNLYSSLNFHALALPSISSLIFPTAKVIPQYSPLSVATPRPVALFPFPSSPLPLSAEKLSNCVSVLRPSWRHCFRSISSIYVTGVVSLFPKTQCLCHFNLRLSSPIQRSSRTSKPRTHQLSGILLLPQSDWLESILVLGWIRTALSKNHLLDSLLWNTCLDSLVRRALWPTIHQWLATT